MNNISYSSVGLLNR